MMQKYPIDVIVPGFSNTKKIVQDRIAMASWHTISAAGDSYVASKMTPINPLDRQLHVRGNSIPRAVGISDSDGLVLEI